jgi:hypothetical protein
VFSGGGQSGFENFWPRNERAENEAELITHISDLLLRFNGKVFEVARFFEGPNWLRMTALKHLEANSGGISSSVILHFC